MSGLTVSVAMVGSTTGSGLPDVPLVVRVLGDGLEAPGDEVRGVGTDAKVPNHEHTSAGAQRRLEALERIGELRSPHTDVQDKRTFEPDLAMVPR